MNRSRICDPISGSAQFYAPNPKHRSAILTLPSPISASPTASEMSMLVLRCFRFAGCRYQTVTPLSSGGWDWGLSIELLFSRKIASPLLRQNVPPRSKLAGSWLIHFEPKTRGHITACRVTQSKRSSA